MIDALNLQAIGQREGQAGAAVIAVNDDRNEAAFIHRNRPTTQRPLLELVTPVAELVRFQACLLAIGALG